MALRTLQSVVTTNYAKLSTDPMLAGDVVAFSSNSLATGVNPAGLVRADRYNSYQTPASTPRPFIVGVCADDALGTNPAGEAPTMINNDPVGSNFVNGSIFQTYTCGFYSGLKRAIGDFKDESIDVVTNLTAGIPTYAQRGVSVYTTPSTQFVTDRFALVTAASASSDSNGWTGTTGSTSPTPGDLLSIGSSNGNGSSTVPYTGTQSAPTVTTCSASTNNKGLLVSAGSVGTIYGSATSIANIPIVGKVDYYDSGAGLLYWTLV